jgi:hypothetical protein
MKAPAGVTANREALRLYREVLRTGECARAAERGGRAVGAGRRRGRHGGRPWRERGARAAAAGGGGRQRGGDAVRGGCDETQRMYYPTVGAEETFLDLL